MAFRSRYFVDIFTVPSQTVLADKKQKIPGLLIFNLKIEPLVFKYTKKFSYDFGPNDPYYLYVKFNIEIDPKIASQFHFHH